jgi:guanine deaminase
MPDQPQLLRAPLFHTPQNPFHNARALRAIDDGGLLIRGGRIAACGEYDRLRAAHPDAAVTDLRGGFLLPGFIDTHTHFPQLRIAGGLGLELLEWLERVALPEEARMANVDYARDTARRFVQALAAHGTTTALVFGAHFEEATAALFDAAAASGLRIVSGMVVSDRALRDELHQSPEAAYCASRELIRRFHRNGRLLYAVTPRFALSASEAMLEMCGALAREHEGVRIQTHLNENRSEIGAVGRAFPWATDYFAVYERFGLCGPRAVMAHNVHPTESELERLAATGTAVAHCPCSNAALGSGVFPMARHLSAGVRFALGTDVGGGIGFGVLKEGLQAHLMQRVAPGGVLLDAGQLLYLATRAGAEALGLESETGDFEQGKSADFVYLRPPAGSPLAAAIERAGSMEAILRALFTLAGAESVREVRVGGDVVYHGREC